MVTNADREYIWNPEIMDQDNNDNDGDDIQVQEEEGVPTLPDWVDVVQSLDVTLDAHQIDKLDMLLQCHSEMLECQAMVSKMLAELGKTLDPVTFRLILKTIIRLMHQINLPDSYLLVPKKAKKAKLRMKSTKTTCFWY